jgi:hypothetical protein
MQVRVVLADGQSMLIQVGDKTATIQLAVSTCEGFARRICHLTGERDERGRPIYREGGFQ